MTMRASIGCIGALLALAVAAAVSARAAEPKAPAGPPQAEDVLRAASQYLAKQKDIDGMVAKLEKEYGMVLPLGELTESDPDKVLTRGVDLAHYVGVHNV